MCRLFVVYCFDEPTESLQYYCTGKIINYLQPNEKTLNVWFRYPHFWSFTACCEKYTDRNCSFYCGNHCRKTLERFLYEGIKVKLEVHYTQPFVFEPCQ